MLSIAFLVASSLFSFLALWCFWKGNLRTAFAFFAVASAMAFYPIFVFVPLWALHEKQRTRMLMGIVLMCAAAGVHFALATGLNMAPLIFGKGPILLFVPTFTALVLACALTAPQTQRVQGVSAFVFAVGAVLPALFFAVPTAYLFAAVGACAVSSWFVNARERALLIDVGGGAAATLFVAVSCLPNTPFLQVFRLFQKIQPTCIFRYFGVIWRYSHCSSLIWCKVSIQLRGLLKNLLPSNSSWSEVVAS